MKVGILTFHAQLNYGGVLQCWALREALKRMGHTVVVDLWLKNPPEYTAGLCVLIMIMATIDKTLIGHTILVNANGKIARYQLVLGTSLLLTVPIAWILLALGFNVYWTSISMIITMAFTAWGRVYFAHKIVQMSARYWLRTVMFPLIFVVTLTMSIGLIPIYLMPASFLRLIVTTVTCELILFPCSWLFLLDHSEKKFIVDKINQVRRKGVKRA